MSLSPQDGLNWHISRPTGEVTPKRAAKGRCMPRSQTAAALRAAERGQGLASCSLAASRLHHAREATQRLQSTA